eukprot:364282-Chlamydomonas_euryale.AAC.43
MSASDAIPALNVPSTAWSVLKVDEYREYRRHLPSPAPLSTAGSTQLRWTSKVLGNPLFFGGAVGALLRHLVAPCLGSPLRCKAMVAVRGRGGFLGCGRTAPRLNEQHHRGQERVLADRHVTVGAADHGRSYPHLACGARWCEAARRGRARVAPASGEAAASSALQPCFSSQVGSARAWRPGKRVTMRFLQILVSRCFTDMNKEVLKSSSVPLRATPRAAVSTARATEAGAMCATSPCGAPASPATRFEARRRLGGAALSCRAGSEQARPYRAGAGVAQREPFAAKQRRTAVPTAQATQARWEGGRALPRAAGPVGYCAARVDAVEALRRAPVRARAAAATR